jgi:hypothetical protein
MKRKRDLNIADIYSKIDDKGNGLYTCAADEYSFEDTMRFGLRDNKITTIRVYRKIY